MIRLMKSSLPTDREALIRAVTAGDNFNYVFFWGHRKSKDQTVTKSSPHFGVISDEYIDSSGRSYSLFVRFARSHDRCIASIA